MKIQKIWFSIYAFVFAMYPSLFLYINNSDELTFFPFVFYTVIALLLFASFLLGALYLLVRDYTISAILTSIMLILFFSHGNIIDLFIPQFTFDIGVERIFSWVVFIMISVIFIFFFFLFHKHPNAAVLFRKFFSIFALVLFVTLIYEIVPKLYIEYEAMADIDQPVASTAIRDDLPDIYYIILDGHAREDVLSELYDVNSSLFFEGLQNMGFYVASQSRSNYTQTFLSQAATLNMSYLDYIADETWERESDDLTAPKLMIRDSSVIKEIKQYGYKYVLFSSLWSGLAQKNALVDQTVSPLISANEFVYVLLERTPLSLFMQNSFTFNFNRNFFKQTLVTLAKVPEDPESTFTYVHFVKPHPPFVFDADGNVPDIKVYIGLDAEWKNFGKNTAKEYKRLYRDQVQYVDKVVLETISLILEKSSITPIIILQSDHGPAGQFVWGKTSDNRGLQERFSILNAYYFPDGDYGELYESITPVNSFRVLLNKYFNGSYELLADKNYFSSYLTPYKFKDVTEQLDLYEQ